MKLITKEIEKRLEKYPFYSQDGKKKEAIAVAKFFLCVGAWTWYILEADLQDNLVYGIAISGDGEAEYAYMGIDELQSIRLRSGLAIERDTLFYPTPLKDIKDKYLQKFLDKIYG